MVNKWGVFISDDALKDLASLDRTIQKRITQFLASLGEIGSPLIRAKALQGPHKGLWRYRLGDYRIICKPENHTLTILVVEIGHRREIYRS